MSRDNLVWIDLEMTGLDPDADCIIEMATVVTDAQLNIVAEGPVIAIHQSDERLARMDEWNTRQHGASGLVARIRASDCASSAVFRSSASLARMSACSARCRASRMLCAF